MMEFWMYSAKKTDSTFVMCIQCDKTSSGLISYYSDTGAVNWEGWQNFSLPLLGDPHRQLVVPGNRHAEGFGGNPDVYTG